MMGMFARLIAMLAENPRMIEWATGNTLFGLSAAALIAVGVWVMLMRLRRHKM